MNYNETGQLNVGRIAALAGGVGFALVGLSVAFGSWYKVDQTQRAVLLRNGAIVSTEQPGLHVKWPLVESVEKVYITNRIVRWPKLEGYSHDQQAAHYMISVNYQIKPDKVAEVYGIWGGEENVVERIVTPNVLKHSKIVIGTFTAQTSIQERGRLNSEIYKALDVATGGTPVMITAVNVEDIKFGPEYEKSINDRMVAEVAVQTLRQNLEREKVQAQIKVTQANATADSTRATATADADAIRLKGNAEASAVEAKAKALGLNANLVTLVQAEKWNGALPTQMLGTAPIPLFNMNVAK